MAFTEVVEKRSIRGRPVAARLRKLSATSRFALSFLTMVLLGAAGSAALRFFLVLVTLD